MLHVNFSGTAKLFSSIFFKVTLTVGQGDGTAGLSWPTEVSWVDRSLPRGGSAHLIVPLWLLSLLLFCLEADPAQCDFRGRGVFSLFRQFRGSPRGGMGLWTSAPLRYSGPGELERLCASVSPSVNGEPRVLASEGTRGIHPDDWRLDSRARTHRHPPGPAAVPGLSRGSRARAGGAEPGAGPSPASLAV